MKKAFVIILIIGVCLLIIGGIVFAVGMSKLNWNFTALSNTEYVEENATFSADEVQEIVVDVSTANVMFLPSEDGTISVDYYYLKDKNGDVISEVVPALESGVLRCEQEEKKKNFMNFNFNRDPKLVIKVPAEKVLAVSIKVSTGDVVFGEDNKERQVASLQIESSTGNITLQGKTVCQKDITIERSTGNLKIKGEVECEDLTLKAGTGNVTANASITAKKIVMTSSTGDVKCTSPMTFDSLDIKASTGNVSVRVAGAQDLYTYLYETSTGKSNVSAFVGGDKKIHIHTSTGDIKLYFGEE